MSRTFLGLLIKLVATLIAAWIAYGLIDGNPFLWILIVAVVVTIINYLIGDLLVLTNFGNIAASLFDGAMGALTAYIISLMTTDFNVSWTSSIVFIVIIAIFEYFLHKYLVEDERVE